MKSDTAPGLYLCWLGDVALAEPACWRLKRNNVISAQFPTVADTLRPPQLCW